MKDAAGVAGSVPLVGSGPASLGRVRPRILLLWLVWGLHIWAGCDHLVLRLPVQNEKKRRQTIELTACKGARQYIVEMKRSNPRVVCCKRISVSYQ